MDSVTSAGTASGAFKPYIGLHNQSGDYVSAKYGQTNGWNGYVVGWTAVLPFTLFDENLFYLTGMK